MIDKNTPEGTYVDQIRDAIKDNLEQAALVNAVNNISAMFILKTQHDYVEATKVVLDDLHNDYFSHGYIGSAVGFTKAKSRVDAMTFLLEELTKELADNGIEIE
jgi:hypothetical protein